ncbi:hypothetical protein [Haloarcula marismortui]|uniref:Uncharacterized protein n=1 Tax=Haloarcula marismortui ATCC 33799 TaxID=662475 RepID=M0K1X0_9EURY|nr:hypothetical protein [Haloarcula californiae]EMA15417.1 hypothetical protein C435_14113 [Haloarcula californiae ATCC 33799]
MPANTTTDLTDDEQYIANYLCCDTPDISKVPWQLRERTDHFEKVVAQCRNCTARFERQFAHIALYIARERGDTCDGCGQSCSPVQAVDVFDDIEVYCQDCAEDSEGDTTDPCCDDPNVVQVPTRSAKLPGRRHRETYGECMNCGATLD